MSGMVVKGTAHKFGDDIDTDAIIPARFLIVTDAPGLARHCMEGADENFALKIKKNDVIVAGKNFGCGSSREHAPVAIKASGISCVIAETFARIFFRNAINIGLPIFECPEASRDIASGDELEIDFNTGAIKNNSSGKTYYSPPLPPFMQSIVEVGGLVERTRQELCKAI